VGVRNRRLTGGNEGSCCVVWRGGNKKYCGKFISVVISQNSSAHVLCLNCERTCVSLLSVLLRDNWFNQSTDRKNDTEEGAKTGIVTLNLQAVVQAANATLHLILNGLS
jgi:hypothetical protein